MAASKPGGLIHQPSISTKGTFIFSSDDGSLRWVTSRHATHCTSFGWRVCYHVIHHGNNRAEVFRKDEDLAAFLQAIAHACVEIEVPVFGYCLMPNHFHLVVKPKEDGDLCRWMQWLFTAHVRRSVNRGTPIGTPTWQTKTADRLGLESTLTARGRPRKQA